MSSPHSGWSNIEARRGVVAHALSRAERLEREARFACSKCMSSDWGNPIALLVPEACQSSSASGSRNLPVTKVVLSESVPLQSKREIAQAPNQALAVDICRSMGASDGAKQLRKLAQALSDSGQIIEEGEVCNLGKFDVNSVDRQGPSHVRHFGGSDPSIARQCGQRRK